VFATLVNSVGYMMRIARLEQATTRMLVIRGASAKTMESHMELQVINEIRKLLIYLIRLGGVEML